MLPQPSTPVPGSCIQTSHFIFYCLSDVGDVGEAARQVISLGLWVQIGTADGGKC